MLRSGLRGPGSFQQSPCRGHDRDPRGSNHEHQAHSTDKFIHYAAFRVRGAFAAFGLVTVGRTRNANIGSSETSTPAVMLTICPFSTGRASAAGTVLQAFQKP